MRNIKFKNNKTIAIEDDDEYKKLKKEKVPKHIKNKTGMVEKDIPINDPIVENVIKGGGDI